MTKSSVPANVRIQTERRNRTARMYSGPSGQATTITTKEPNRMARPSVDRTRPSHVAPSDTSDASRTSDELSASPPPTSVGAAVAGGALPVVGVDAPGAVSSGDGVDELSTSKLNEPRAPSSPLGCSVVQLTLQVPAGIGTRIGTVRV